MRAIILLSLLGSSLADFYAPPRSPKYSPPPAQPPLSPVYPPPVQSYPPPVPAYAPAAPFVPILPPSPAYAPPQEVYYPPSSKTFQRVPIIFQIPLEDAPPVTPYPETTYAAPLRPTLSPPRPVYGIPTPPPPPPPPAIAYLPPTSVYGSPLPGGATPVSEGIVNISLVDILTGANNFVITTESSHVPPSPVYGL